ncbi:MAG: hypothetical protein EBR73_14695 [Rhodobacteraceae bacterium]|nr:hypothetical protein [Paracoccaceae bacterium]
MLSIVRPHSVAAERKRERETMDSHQIAVAIFNDRSTEPARMAAVRELVAGASRDNAAHRLLAAASAEVKKSLYEGAGLVSLWEIAHAVLDMQIAHAIDTLELARQETPSAEPIARDWTGAPLAYRAPGLGRFSSSDK